MPRNSKPPSAVPSVDRRERPSVSLQPASSGALCMLSSPATPPRSRSRSRSEPSALPVDTVVNSTAPAAARRGYGL